MKTIFLSSTSQDLRDYRQAAYDVVEGLEGYHCVRMENFGARNATAHTFDTRKVDTCDLFIGIIGNFHGSTPAGSEQSYTELEYEVAVALGKPRLMFLSSLGAPMLPTPLESLEKQQRQQQFRQRIASEHIIDFFNSPSDLTSKVVTSIFNWEYEQCSGVPTIDAKWAAIPHLPHPYLAHPYPLQDHFTGRIKEDRKSVV